MAIPTTAVLKKVAAMAKEKKVRRPVLNEVPLTSAIKPMTVNITMSPGQWDGFLKAAYDSGDNLIEVENEFPVRAYRKLPDA